MRDAGRDYERVQGALALLLTAIVIVGGVDIIMDGPDEWLSLHVATELVLIGLSLATAAFLWSNWIRAHARLRAAETALKERQTERDAWRGRTETILAGLGQAIDDQLQEWGLTPAERETALLVLKGLSHREIADMTERSDRTVRQHAVAVYRKSGLRGRAELSAFFLEDLLLPLQRDR